jgi:hypothetical protein
LPRGGGATQMPWPAHRCPTRRTTCVSGRKGTEAATR